MPGLEKELILGELKKRIEGCPYVFFVSFKGLRAGDFGQLRRSLEKVSKAAFVGKRTLLKRAFAEGAVRLSNGEIEGSLFLVTAEKDPQLASKVLVDFAKDKPGFELAGAFVEGSLFKAAYIKELSKLPSRLELIAKVVGGMKAPISALVMDLRALVSSLVIVLDQVSKKKA